MIRRLRRSLAFLAAANLINVGCSTARYPQNAVVNAAEEAQTACKMYGEIEKEIIHGASLSGMLVFPLVMGPMIGFVLPQWLMGLKPAAENDRKRDEIFEVSLKKCLEPDSQTADLLRIAGHRYRARKDYARAEVLFRRAFDVEAAMPDEEIRARILEDYGQLLWETERRQESQETLLRAREIRRSLEQKKQADAKPAGEPQ